MEHASELGELKIELFKLFFLTPVRASLKSWSQNYILPTANSLSKEGGASETEVFYLDIAIEKEKSLIWK